MKIYLHLIFLIFTIASFPNNNNPYKITREEIEFSDFKITFSLIDVDSYFKKIQVGIKRKKNKKSGSVFLSQNIFKLSKVYRNRRHLIVLGKLLKSAGSAISIIDLEKKILVKEVLCFRPVISPDKTRIVFETFFPRFTPRERMFPSLSMIDLKAPSKTPRKIYPEFQSYKIRKMSREKARSPERRMSGFVSPFLWSLDSQNVFFIEKHGVFGSWRNYRSRFISIDFAKGADCPIVVVHDLNLRKFAKKKEKAHEIKIYAEDMKWSRDHSIEVTLHPQRYGISQKVFFVWFDIKRKMAVHHTRNLNIDGLLWDVVNCSNLKKRKSAWLSADEKLKRKNVIKNAIDKIKDYHAANLEKIRAFQVLGYIKSKNVLSEARIIVQTTKDLSLKKYAILYIGQIGIRNDIELLTNISKIKENDPLRHVIHAAVKNIKKRK